MDILPINSTSQYNHAKLVNNPPFITNYPAPRHVEINAAQTTPFFLVSLLCASLNNINSFFLKSFLVSSIGSSTG